MSDKTDKPTPHQAECIKRMREHGRLVYVRRSWTLPGAKWIDDMSPYPEWSSDLATLKAMVLRGWIVKVDGRADYKADWILSDTAPA